MATRPGAVTTRKTDSKIGVQGPDALRNVAPREGLRTIAGMNAQASRHRGILTHRAQRIAQRIVIAGIHKVRPVDQKFGVQRS